MKIVNTSLSKSTSAARRHDRGFVMVTAMLILVGLMAAAMLATTRTAASSRHVGRDYHEEKVFQVADGGANVAESWLRNVLHTVADPSQSQLDNIPSLSAPGYNFLEYSITKDSLRHDVVLQNGAYAGMLAEVQPYRIRSRAENTLSSVEQAVEVEVSQFWVNLFQYAIYYDGDLELFPRNPSQFVGRIHSNGNIYLGSDSNYDIIGTVSAAGHIYNTPKDATQVYRGKARVADRSGQWQDLSYDSRDPDWTTRSLDDWEGLVMDSAHGVVVQPAPVLALPNPIDLIKRGVFSDDSLHRDLKFYYRAGLKIMDGVATDYLGNTVTLPAGVITNSSVWDFREQRTMQMRNIDMAALVASGYVPANHVLYVSYSHTDAAIRIINGATLPAGGLTIATDNPCYVKGNYNTVNKKPAAFFCDAFNYYSNGWLDANATRNVNFRNATNSRMNACIVTGDDPTTNGHYSGGAGNLIRLHERWLASSELTYRGSMVCIWESEQAEGDFNRASFAEHHRNSSWDQALLDPAFWPDRMLVEHNLARSSWRPM